MSLTMPVFSKRSGCAGNHGYDYEVNMAALLSLRFSFEEWVTDFWIATNFDAVGDMDDVVLCVTTAENKKIAIFIQLKHVEAQNSSSRILKHKDFTCKTANGGKNRNDDAFSVFKYFKGYITFQKNLNQLKNQSKSKEIANVQHLKNVERFYYILYTNKRVDMELSCLVDTKENVVLLNKLNTTDSVIYKFNNKEFQNLETTVNSGTTSNDFLENLYLFPNQTNKDGVSDLIKEEISNIFCLHKFANVNFEEVTRSYLEIFTLWTKGYTINNDKIVHTTLSKQDIINILSDTLLEPYKYKISENQFTGYCGNNFCPQKMIWEELISDKVISIVHGDDLTRQFLRDFIGSQVKQALEKHGECWKTPTSNKFWNQIEMMKICSINKNNSISMVDVCKYMWFYKKLPQLLEIDDVKQYDDILKILEISNYKLKAIVITSNNRDFAYRKIDQVKQFASLGDLNCYKKWKILNLMVQFQGRISVKLGNVTKESMHEYLKCDDIIHILCSDFNVGNRFDFKYEKKCHIERNISKILISFDALVKIQKEFFLVETQNNKEIKILTQKLHSFGEKNDSNIRIININTEDVKIVKEVKEKYKDFHRLVFHEEYLEWKESYGNFENIKMFQIDTTHNSKEDMYENVSSFVDSFNTNKLEIISGCAGMGKSELLNYISCYAKSCFWILPVGLNHITENNLPSQVFDIYKNELSKDSSVQNLQLSLLVFEDMIEAKKLLILFDGVDEICGKEEKNRFSNLIGNFRKASYSVLLSTRENMTYSLESDFKVISRKLKPFTWNEQKDFLAKFFEIKLMFENHDVLINFSEKLLNATKQNLMDRDEQFTAIPLQLELVANYFLKKSQESTMNNAVILAEKFDLLDLYEKFVLDKNKILCKKYGEGQKYWLEELERRQAPLALSSLIGYKFRPEFGLEKRLQNEESNAELVQLQGILSVRKMKDQILKSFIHRTFAEYIAAKWFTENFEGPKVKETLKDMYRVRLEQPDNLQFFFAIFDRILVRNCKFHKDIINGSVHDLNSKLKTNAESWFENDKIKRTAFHILSLYANDYKKKDLKEILETVQLEKWKGNSEDDFGYSIKDYAILTGSWTFFNIIYTLNPYFMKTIASFTGPQSFTWYSLGSHKNMLGLLESDQGWYIITSKDMYQFKSGYKTMYQLTTYKHNLNGALKESLYSLMLDSDGVIHARFSTSNLRSHIYGNKSFSSILNMTTKQLGKLFDDGILLCLKYW